MSVGGDCEMDEREFYSVRDVARLLRVNEETVRRWIREDKLPAERGSGRHGSRISQADMRYFLEHNRTLLNDSIIDLLGLAQSSQQSQQSQQRSPSQIAGLASAASFSSFYIPQQIEVDLVALQQEASFNEREELLLQREKLTATIRKLQTELRARQHQLEIAEKQLTKINQWLGGGLNER
jgi:excisionase family DNA binding protein